MKFGSSQKYNVYLYCENLFFALNSELSSSTDCQRKLKIPTAYLFVRRDGFLPFQKALL